MKKLSSSLTFLCLNMLIIFCYACSQPGTSEEQVLFTKDKHCFKNEAEPIPGTRADTQVVEFPNASLQNLPREMHFTSYLIPEIGKLTGEPNGYAEDISNVPNWAQETFECYAKAGVWVDTNDRDFERYWYNDRGLLCKYQVKDFGDIVHHECLYSYQPDGTIERIEKNTLGFRKVNELTVHFDRDKLTVLRHDISDAQLLTGYTRRNDSVKIDWPSCP